MSSATKLGIYMIVAAILISSGINLSSISTIIFISGGILFIHGNDK